MEKHWCILEPDLQIVKKLTQDLACTPAFAKILVNRKIESAEQAVTFLHPSLKDLRPPFALKDMDAAVHRIGQAIAGGEKILIFGDYDVDGVTSAIVILEFLNHTGTNPSLYIPHRLTEGYGLQIQHVIDYAIPKKIELIITTDCGSSSHEAVQAARSAGIDVIVTDHHRVSNRRPAPDAIAMVNPKRPDCEVGFEHLSGVGVAFMLTVSLRKHLREIDFWHARSEPNLLRLCDLVALGTVADAVPLVAENRILTHAGINLIKAGKTRPGLKRLLEVSGINGTTISSEDIAYKIVPRLNAAGRLEHAQTAADLLTAQDLATAGQLAQSLDMLNSARKETESEILTEIHNYMAKNPQETNKSAIVLAHPNWHEGVLGIVAARLVNRYSRPVVLISTRDGLGKGSARSIAGLDVYRTLSACSQCLETYGGHSMAAGLRIKEDRIEVFKEIFETSVKNAIRPDNFAPKLLIDCELGFNEISDRLLDEIDTLGPFGPGNPGPVFMAQNVTVKTSQIVGRQHRRMRLCQPASGNRKSLGAIYFNSVTGAPPPEAYDKIAFRLNWNRWNDEKYLQLIIEAAEP